MYAQEHLVQAGKQTPAEMRAGIEYAPTPLLSHCGARLVVIRFASFWSAGNIHIPLSRQARANPQFIVLSGVT